MMPSIEMMLAERMLADYRLDLTVEFQGKRIPVFRFIENFLKITNKNGEVIPFRLNFQQCRLYIEICTQMRAGRPVRIDVLKARQIGFTTFISALFFTLTMFNKNIKTAVMADIVDHAKNIFAKYEFFYEHLDDSNPNRALIRKLEDEGNVKEARKYSWKPALAANRGQDYLKTKFGESSIEVVVAGKSAGRSGTYQYLHLSEVAFFDNLKDTLTGVLSTVSSTNLNSMVFMETTANGFNEYKSLWDRHQSGKSNYKAFFTSWFENPEYSKKFLVGESLPVMEEWLHEMQDRYHLTDEQMNWYQGIYYDYDDKGKTLQEYPCCPTDAFMVTGSCVFGSEAVAERREEIVSKPNLGMVRSGQFTYLQHFNERGDKATLSDVKWRDRRNGLIRIYEEPIAGHPYVGICDPNNGGSDSSAVQIIDNRTLKQVAVMQSADLSLDEVAYQFYCLGKMYNTALLSNEMNLGKTVMEYLIKLSYPKLYVDQSLEVDSFRRGFSTRYGHKTEKNNRQLMIESMKIAFRQNPSIISDFETICQMETFQKTKHESRAGQVTYKDEASAGEHDDLVMAYAAFFVVRNQQTTLTTTDVETITRQLTFEELDKQVKEMNRSRIQSPSSRTQFEKAVGIDFGEEYGNW